MSFSLSIFCRGNTGLLAQDHGGHTHSDIYHNGSDRYKESANIIGGKKFINYVTQNQATFFPKVMTFIRDIIYESS